MKSITIRVSLHGPTLRLELPTAELLAAAEPTPTLGSPEGSGPSVPPTAVVIEADAFLLELEPLPGGFPWSWPSGRHQYLGASSGRATWKRRAYDVRIGEITEERAGRPRRYILIVINGYPTLNFVEGEDGRFASIITPPGSRASVRSDADLPAGYVEAGLQITDYHEVIRGPGASRGRAVVVDRADDFAAMVKHAILRWEGRNASLPPVLGGADDGDEELDPAVLALLESLAKDPRETLILGGSTASKILGHSNLADLAAAINRAAELGLVDRWSTSGTPRTVTDADRNAVVGVRLTPRGAALVDAPFVI